MSIEKLKNELEILVDVKNGKEINWKEKKEFLFFRRNKTISKRNQSSDSLSESASERQEIGLSDLFSQEIDGSERRSAYALSDYW